MARNPASVCANSRKSLDIAARTLRTDDGEAGGIPENPFSLRQVSLPFGTAAPYGTLSYRKYSQRRRLC